LKPRTSGEDGFTTSCSNTPNSFSGSSYLGMP